MCGIAGYNISPTIAEALNKKQLKQLVREGVSRNMHRGTDAAGIFVSSSKFEDQEIPYWKSQGNGMENMPAIKGFINSLPGIPTNLALHTRAKSTGFSETNNDNNHPVIYNGVAANHNGMIRNHTNLKQADFIPQLQADLYKNDKIPPVDSIVIPMLLDSVKNPFEETELIAEILSSLEGGWAFHLSWADYPGLALLVAGPSYPLTVRYTSDRLAYSSEADAVTMMWHEIDMPWAHNNVARELDAGTFVLVNEGTPVSFGQYDVERKVQSHRIKKLGFGDSPAKGFVRYIKDGDKIDAIKVDNTRAGVTGSRSEDWTATLNDDAVLIYDRNNGGIQYTTEAIAGFREWNGSTNLSTHAELHQLNDLQDLVLERNVFEWCAEADEIYVCKRPQTSLVYAWFGATEIVLSEYGSVLGIYDWAKGTYKRIKTSAEIEKERKAIVSEKMQDYTPLLAHESKLEKFRKWLRENSVDATLKSKKSGVVGGSHSHHGTLPGVQRNVDVIRREQVEAYRRLFPELVEEDEKKQDNSSDDDNGNATYQGWHTGFTSDQEALEILEAFGFEAPTGVRLPVRTMARALQEPLIDADEIDLLYAHSDPTIGLIPFFESVVCGVHAQSLPHHTNPLKCDTSLLIAALTIDLFKGINTYLAFFQDELDIRVEFGSEAALGCKHEWKVDVSFPLELYGLTVNIIESEKCKVCNSIRTIKRYPDIVVKICEWYMEEFEGEETKDDSMYAVDSAGTVWSD